MQQFWLRALVWVMIPAASAAVLISLAEYHFTLFHAIVQLVCLIIASAVFFVSWNGSRVHRSGYLEVLGIGFLFVAALDGLHLLSYEGTGVIPGVGINESLHVRLVARLLEGAAFVLAPSFIGRPPSRLVTLAGFGVLAGTGVAVALGLDSLPIFYDEASGITFAKAVSEYAVAGLFFVALVRLRRHRDDFDRSVARLLALVLALSVVQAGTAASYTMLGDTLNIAAHLLKLAAAVVLYRALVDIGLRQPYELLFRDLKSREERLRALSLTDALTRMYNRRAFFIIAPKQLAAARRTASRVLLIFADLDHLKEINDVHGHAEGDRALVDAAGLLRTAVREADVIARLGGDEFAILATLSPDAEPDRIVERLETALADFRRTTPRPYRLSFTVGTASADADHPRSLADLLQEADAAMYRRKQSRRNGGLHAVPSTEDA